MEELSKARNLAAAQESRLKAKKIKEELETILKKIKMFCLAYEGQS